MALEVKADKVSSSLEKSGPLAVSSKMREGCESGGEKVSLQKWELSAQQDYTVDFHVSKVRNKLDAKQR